MASVEFLSDDGSEPGPDEQLITPPRSRRAGRRWVLAVLVAGVAVVALTRPSHTSGQRHFADPACRTFAGCSVHGGVPAPIARLARDYLPLGMHLRVRTVVAVAPLTSATRFVARDIYARADSVTVLIRVRRGGSGTRAIVPDPLGTGSLLLHKMTSGFVVRLQYLAPDTVPPMTDRLRALIRDPRLTSA